MGAWFKIFEDKTEERGLDQDIKAGKASWSKGRLDGIKEVRIYDDRTTCSLYVQNTSWHQFDRFITEVVVGQTAKPTRIYRAIQAELKDHHVGQTLICSYTGAKFYWAIVQELRSLPTNYFFCKLIKQNNVGQWLTMVLPLKDYPCIKFSSRGKINDYEHISN